MRSRIYTGQDVCVALNAPLLYASRAGVSIEEAGAFFVRRMPHIEGIDTWRAGARGFLNGHLDGAFLGRAAQEMGRTLPEDIPLLDSAAPDFFVRAAIKRCALKVRPQAQSRPCAQAKERMLCVLALSAYEVGQAAARARYAAQVELALGARMDALLLAGETQDNLCRALGAALWMVLPKEKEDVR
nr:hypothetical protein [Maliibacterium massiliense]